MSEQLTNDLNSYQQAVSLSNSIICGLYGFKSPEDLEAVEEFRRGFRNTPDYYVLPGGISLLETFTWKEPSIQAEFVELPDPYETATSTIRSFITEDPSKVFWSYSNASLILQGEPLQGERFWIFKTEGSCVLINRRSLYDGFRLNTLTFFTMTQELLQKVDFTRDPPIYSRELSWTSNANNTSFGAMGHLDGGIVGAYK